MREKKTGKITTEDEVLDLVEKIILATPAPITQAGDEQQNALDRIEQLARVTGHAVLRLYNRLQAGELKLFFIDAMLTALREGMPEIADQPPSAKAAPEGDGAVEISRMDAGEFWFQFGKGKPRTIH